MATSTRVGKKAFKDIDKITTKAEANAAKVGKGSTKAAKIMKKADKQTDKIQLASHLSAFPSNQDELNCVHGSS